MAPRRNNSTHSGVDVHNLLGLGGGDTDHVFDISSNSLTGGIQTTTISTSTTSTTTTSSGIVGGHQHHHHHNNHHQTMSNHHLISENFTRCCVPTGECFKVNSPDFGLINLDELSDCVRVICNNENCTAGQYMHRDCFESWEQGVLTSLRSTGRARSWSDRQRAQNLWTKKGYDLVYKACGCKCNRGHLKKDLDWVPPTNNNIFGRNDEEATKKKKKRNRNNQKPTLAISSANSGAYHPNSQMNNGVIMSAAELRGRTGSLSSSNGSTSPPVSASSEHSISPIHNINLAPGKKHQPLTQQQAHLQQQQQQQHKSKVELYSERVRSTSGCNGIFSRRLDFSSFNLLPKTRLNSYQVKMEDEGNHGNDETRLFILSSLAQHQKSRVSCILCEEAMLVFDRYPLVDGTFFLSPKQHAAGCIEVKQENRTYYLTAVCMGCLDGTSANRAIYCRFCGERWDGSSLVLGTMYCYDIFAAMPCCNERLTCNACFKLLLHPQQRLNWFSGYSHGVSCPYCTTTDAHFVKPLGYCFTKQPIKTTQQLP